MIFWTKRSTHLIRGVIVWKPYPSGAAVVSTVSIQDASIIVGAISPNAIGGSM